MLVEKRVLSVRNQQTSFNPITCTTSMFTQKWISSRLRKEACKHLGESYNASFYPDGAGFYCSQYIAEVLPIFETIPMKFGNETQEISDFWREYYRKLGLPVPLNQAGTNPSQLAASPLLECKERNLHDSEF